MSTAGAVHYESDGTVARITFDRPEARNAMTWAMYQQLAGALDRLEDEEPRVCVLRGAGGHFVAGTDIAQFESFASGEDGVKYERMIEDVLSLLEDVPVPTIAAVEGNAAGAGLLIAACCDIRIATADARFSAPIARTVGNTLSLANHARLVACLGPSRTKGLIMTAGVLDAEEAVAAGFVHSIATVAEFQQRLDELVARVAALAPLSVRATRLMVKRVTEALAQGADDDLLREVYGSRDFREGVSAFREKRAPNWEGR